MALPQEIIDAIEQIAEEKFNELVAAHKLNPDVVSGDVKTFEDEQMLPLDGDEPITQGFFRKFLAWMSTYLDTIVTNIEAMTFDSVRYVTPVDLDPVPDCGKIIAPVAHLVVTGAGIKPTVPTPPTTPPNDAGFNIASDIMEGQFAYNETDNIWYYRGGNTIYELKECLGLGITDVDGLTAALAAKEPTQVGKSLSENDLTAGRLAIITDAASHMAIENIHLPPDGTSIRQSGDDALEIIASYIIDLFSATLPLAIDVNGNITLAIDDTTLEIVDNKLKVKAVAVTTKLSFVEETGVLSVDPGGADSVDLSSLAGGGGAVDLSNYVKKTGEVSQQISGNLLVTGEVQPFA